MESVRFLCNQFSKTKFFHGIIILNILNILNYYYSNSTMELVHFAVFQ